MYCNFQVPYEVDVPEDEEIGKTILQNIEVEDKDSVGDSLEVGCLPNEQVFFFVSRYIPHIAERQRESKGGKKDSPFSAKFIIIHFVNLSFTYYKIITIQVNPVSKHSSKWDLNLQELRLHSILLFIEIVKKQ